MHKGTVPRLALLLPVSALILATPKPAHAYVDPGSGAMLWQLLAAGVIGSLFYVRRVFKWLRDRLVFRPSSRVDRAVMEEVASNSDGR